VNLLTKTEQFDDAVWQKDAVTATRNQPDPLGASNSATRITETADTNVHGFLANTGNRITVSANTSVTSRIWLANVQRRYVAVMLAQALNNGMGIVVDMQTGTVTDTKTSAGYSVTSSEVSALIGGGRYVTITGNYAGTLVIPHIRPSLVSAWPGGVFSTAANGMTIYVGDAEFYFDAWGADLRVANDGVGIPPYQRVNTATDYDSVGFPLYLRFDGVDDSLVTPTITPGTDKAQIFAGVRKTNTSAAFNCLIETGAGGTGGLAVFAPDSNNNNYAFWLKSQSRPTAASTYASPITNVIAVEHDCAQATAALQTKPRINGAGVAIAASTAAVSGNFAAEVLNIGRRGGTTLPFNGRLHSMIVRFGPTLTAEQITQTETWVNGKTRAFV
jgi:hypothetical protein